MTNPWFRMYTEAVDDEKLRLLSFEDRWHFIALLCCKGKGITDEANSSLARRKIAVKLGLDPATLDEVARRLAEVGLIDAQTLQPLAWEKRQFASDHDPTRAERLRKFRERQATENQNKQNGNGRETDVKRMCNAPQSTDTDTDTDTDTETLKTRREVVDSESVGSPRSRATRTHTRKTNFPSGFAITPELQAWADEHGYHEPLAAHLENFRDKSIAKGYTYADWMAAFRNAIRDDWAGLRKPIAPGRPMQGKPAPAVSNDPRVAEFATILSGTHIAGQNVIIEGECARVAH